MRVPKSTASEQKKFYQKTYSQGYTTEVPDPQQLTVLLQKRFKGTERDYTRYLKLFSGLGIKNKMRVLEYGSSWGYGAWQFAQAGLRVTAFEISEPRCQYARKNLGVNAFNKKSEIHGPFDVCFSSHVLEHVDNVEDTLDWQMGLLRPGGWLVGVTPNGSLPYRERYAENFHRLWGLVHPQLLNDEFLQKKFMGMDLRLGSISDLEGVDEVTQPGKLHPTLHRWELAFAVRKPASAID